MAPGSTWLTFRDSFPDALRGIHLAEESGDIITTSPEWVEPTEGVHTFGRKGNGGSDKPAPVEPEHDAATGEVKAAVTPTSEASKAAAKQEAIVEQPKPKTDAKGQAGLGW